MEVIEEALEHQLSLAVIGMPYDVNFEDRGKHGAIVGHPVTPLT